MSTSNCTGPIAGSAANDIWRQHEAQIRNLYQNKKKTLKQVKEEMEKNGFPEKPPGKKRLRKPTTIRLDGRNIPFDEAWKEIRRSGAHILSPRQLPQGNLPCGIECETSTGTATWESLMHYSEDHHHKQIFKYLLEIGIRYEWTNRYNFGVLASALHMDCPTDVLVSILAYLRVSSHISWREILHAISKALENKYVGIAKLLVQRVDINAELARDGLVPPSPPRSVFLAFILGFDSTYDSNWHILDFFLSNGADVDRFLPSGLFTREPSRDWYNRNEIHQMRKMDLRIIRSLIEYDENSSSFSIFLPHTHDILDAVLRQLRDQITDDRLQLLDILMQKGADLREDHLESAVEKDGIKVLTWLHPRVKNFPAKAAGALAKAALLNNFEAVEFLLQSGVDPNSYISARTAKLVCPRRFAVKHITQGSVEQTYSVQAIAAGVGRLNLRRNFDYSSLRMCQVLAEKGAKLVVGPNDSTPFAFTGLLLENGWGDAELFAKVKFALSTLKQSKQWERPPAFLLELCVENKTQFGGEEIQERLKIFEYILSEGADVNPGSPLAALVTTGPPKELVERVLSLGAKLDNYTAVTYPGPRVRFDTKTPLQSAALQGNEDLVYLFLEAGADINSPARGKYGKTALQAICSWHPATEKEHRRKMTICDILLNGGADVNAAPARRMGSTALQLAATGGDLELTAMLIRHGAHVNAPGMCGGSALDDAARGGRLDVVKLLLNANALSAHRRSTGYHGSIKIAERYGHHATACLIRDHLANALGPDSSFVTFGFEEGVEDDHTHDSDTDGGSTEDGSSDDEYGRSEHELSTDEYWKSMDEESSECDAGEDSDDSVSQADSLMRLAPADGPADGPADAQVVPDLQAVENIFTDDFMGYLGTEVDLNAEYEPMPDSSMGPLTEILGTQSFPGWQIVANTSMNDRVGYSDMGFVLPEEDMQTQWENESTFQNPFETLVRMPDDSALWQQVFEMQDQELGIATPDAGLQMSTSDNSGRPDVEGQDAAEQSCKPEVHGD
ncbi:hypothetical protein J7T55_015258 [Diaporthe amygdali]|uniref:uncharacterized protein n=1 Tax=Phomopsis amygdali TaxID=1214568 RepID=UPI0022FE969F|nr:uncharacterized protein J7T55_015258 [Diaporthe amygdali]KAJ0120529.1 hypothetical protein J7T55_015258 [Diaporthe amygdali]